ncbi:hypothetical protein AAHE18_17G213900 [Arachis hypogaea]
MPFLPTVKTTSTTTAAASAASSPVSTTLSLVTISRQVTCSSTIVTLRASSTAITSSSTTTASTSSVTVTVTVAPAFTAAITPTEPSTTSSSSSSSPSTSKATTKRARSSHGRDIDGLSSAGVAVINGKLNRLALGECTVTVGSNGRVVDEEILAAIVGSYESETLLCVEPFHCARGSLSLRCHGFSKPKTERREGSGKKLNVEVSFFRYVGFVKG